jgi:hypothetical protein
VATILEATETVEVIAGQHVLLLSKATRIIADLESPTRKRKIRKKTALQIPALGSSRTTTPQMITLETALDSYYTFSEKLSEVARQLALAGVAAVWLLKVGGENAGGIKWNETLLWPLGAFILSLAFDLAQYAYYTAYWRLFHRHHERIANEARLEEREPEEFIYVSPYIHLVGESIFWAKVASVAIGYFWLLIYIGSRVA